jgi:hypothetical protein
MIYRGFKWLLYIVHFVLVVLVATLIALTLIGADEILKIIKIK